MLADLTEWGSGQKIQLYSMNKSQGFFFANEAKLDICTALTQKGFGKFSSRNIIPEIASSTPILTKFS